MVGVGIGIPSYTSFNRHYTTGMFNTVFNTILQYSIQYSIILILHLSVRTAESALVSTRRLAVSAGYHADLSEHEQSTGMNEYVKEWNGM